MDDGDTECNTASFHIFREPDRGAETPASFFGQIEDGDDGAIRSASSKL